MPNQLFDNLKAWKETAALITCKKNYNSESKFLRSAKFC
jgi:hypothetical protein